MIPVSKKVLGAILLILGIAYFVLAYTKVQQDHTWMCVSIASIFSVIAGINFIDN